MADLGMMGAAHPAAIARALAAMQSNQPNPNYTRGGTGWAGERFSDMGVPSLGMGPDALNPLDVGGSPYQTSEQAQRAIGVQRAIDDLLRNPSYLRGHAGFADQDLRPGAQPEMGTDDIMSLLRALEFVNSRPNAIGRRLGVNAF